MNSDRRPETRATSSASVYSKVLSAADQAMRYAYKRWGFGEDIAMRALWRLGRTLRIPRYSSFVQEQFERWMTNRPPDTFSNPDHVVPGVCLLEMYHETGQANLLAAARSLGALYERFPRINGIPVHRPDLEGWATHIWVDCLYMDAPFLLRLWRVTGEHRWYELAREHVLSYTQVLRDQHTGLFFHGYDCRLNLKSPCLWGRGNGWALLGLIEALESLPSDDQLRSRLLCMLEQQVRALAALQSSSGHWHTVLDDPTTPLETSVAAFVVAGFSQGARLGLISEQTWVDAKGEAVVQRALEALLESIDADGSVLGVSEATPIGDRMNYVSRRTGVFPWGQGPFILAALESGLVAPRDSDAAPRSE